MADGDWVRFIIDNRHTSVLAHDFDIVAGPIPSAELLTAIDNYENGIADYSLITKALGKQQPLQQIAFLSEYAVYTLTFSEAIEVDLC